MTFDFLNQNDQQGLNGGLQFQQDPFSSIPTTTTALQGFDFGDIAGSYKMPLLDRLMGGLKRVGQGAAANEPLLNFGVGALQGISSLYQGNKQMGLFKDQLNTQKSQWDSQFNLNRNMINEQLSDRQSRRAAANPDGNVTSPTDYIKKWGV